MVTPEESTQEGNVENSLFGRLKWWGKIVLALIALIEAPQAIAWLYGVATPHLSVTGADPISPDVLDSDFSFTNNGYYALKDVSIRLWIFRPSEYLKKPPREDSLSRWFMRHELSPWGDILSGQTRMFRLSQIERRYDEEGRWESALVCFTVSFSGLFNSQHRETFAFLFDKTQGKFHWTPAPACGFS